MIISKQLLSNFEAEIAGEPKQLEAQPEKVVAYKKNVYSSYSLVIKMGFVWIWP